MVVNEELVQGVQIKFLCLLRSAGQGYPEGGEAEPGVDGGEVEYGRGGAGSLPKEVL